MQGVSWAKEVVDNENLGKKSSKSEQIPSQKAWLT